MEKISSLDTPRSVMAAKAVGQVMVALKNSKTEAGPTMTEIFKFITGSMCKPATKRQVITALKRSVEFGILKRYKGHYLILSADESPSDFAIQPLSKKIAKTRKVVEKIAKRPRGPLKIRKSKGGHKEPMDELFPSPPIQPLF